MRRRQNVRLYRVDSRWDALTLAGQVAGWVARAGIQRYRTELALAVGVLVLWVSVRPYLPGAFAMVGTAAIVGGLLRWPRSRELIFGLLGCARTRRRLLDCMRETRVATSAGRLPVVLRSRTTPAGERLTFGLFPGQSAELLEARVEEFRAAARAMDVTVTRDPVRADVVTVDVARRDLLSPSVVLTSPLVALAAAISLAPAITEEITP